MAKKKEDIDYAKELAERFEQWDKIKEYGCSDPFWEDGMNLNLVRNHIIYYKREIEEKLPVDKYPEVYYRETPPKVDSRYMARVDDIRENAQKTLELFEQDENLKLIKRKMLSVDDKFLKENCAKNIAGYEAGLKIAIESDDLVSMRRYENYDTYLQSFQTCADKIRAYQPPENEQLDMFSALEAAEESEEFDMSM